MQWVVKKHNDAEGGKKRENGVNSYTENVKRKKNQRQSSRKVTDEKGSSSRGFTKVMLEDIGKRKKMPKKDKICNRLTQVDKEKIR